MDMHSHRSEGDEDANAPAVEVRGFPLTPTRTPVSSAEIASAATAIRDGHRPDWLGTWSITVRSPNELVLATDDFGTRPLFVGDDSDPQASKDIWPVIPSGAELDTLALADFVLVGHFLGTRTAFKGVTACPPAALIRMNGLDLAIKQEPPILESDESLFEPRLDGLLDGYKEITPALGVPLSGGLDSRVVLASAVDAGFDTHAWTFVEVANSDEERIAARIADAAGVPHTVSKAEAGDAASLRRYVERTSGQLSLAHAHGLKYDRVPPQPYSVMASGAGAGHVKGTFVLPRSTAADAALSMRIRQLLMGRELSELQRYLPGVPQWSEWVRETVSGWLEAAGAGPRASDWAILLNRPNRFNVWGRLARAPDQDFIAPFLDRELIAAAHAITAEADKPGSRYRTYIARRWPALAAVPWVDTGLPVDRDPGILRRAARAARRRTGLGRPITFSNQRAWYRSMEPLIEAPMSVGLEALESSGVDCRALLADHPAESPAGRAFRLRIATIGSALGIVRSGSWRA